MPKVVYEGRRVINNVQSSASLFLMKTFFTMLMAIIVLCLPYMQTYPFRTSQMIMLEVFVIGLPAFFLSMQPNDSLVEGKFISHVIKKSVPAALVMTISVVIIEILKKTVGLFPENDYIVYTTMSVYALTFAGCVNLFTTCKPFNKYRALLFGCAIFCVLAITVLTIFGLIPLFSETIFPMIPLSKYWHHLLIVFGIVIIDIPLLIGLQKLFSFIEKKVVKK
jgi:cation-transporting ATPase E